MKQSFVLGFISVLLHRSLLQNDALGDGGGVLRLPLRKSLSKGPSQRNFVGAQRFQLKIFLGLFK